MQAQAQAQINASPERLWSMVSDVTRMGEWSPETVRATWLDGATGPAVGARFQGRNQRGPMKWTTTATITAAEPGREFAFLTAPGYTAWRYRFEPIDGGTLVTESCRVVPRDVVGRVMADLLPLIGRRRHLERGMQQTVERLKAAAEAPTS
jgi:uncharacterized protein YndB with AHSA1/START domain